MLLYLKHFLSPLIATAVTLSPVISYATVADDAKELMEAGDYEAAGQILSVALEDASPKEQGILSNLLGICFYEEGLYDEALPRFETAKKKGVNEANLYLGRLAYLNYDFPKATSLYSAYKNGAKNARNILYDDFTDQLSMAKQMLEHVENIAVIDSLTVDSDLFFTSYRLPAAAGRLLRPDKMPREESRDLASMAFSNENGEFLMWAEPDSIGILRIVESSRLTDGKWSEPYFTPEHLNMESDADYPFMMPDGTTLYYASDGDKSMGGYDIFVATRDAASGEYLQPQNIGMPFNSPFDDYMLAIDEYNGIGWWATDRNRIPGKVTIYVYALPEMRRNIDPDDEKLIDRARISDIKASWPEDEDELTSLKSLKDNIAHIDTRPPKQVDFHLPMPGGKVYTTWSDFQSNQAAAMMKQYLKDKAAYDAIDAKLAKLRKEYSLSRRNPSIAKEIAGLESQSEANRAKLKKQLSEIYRIELLR